MVGPTQQLQQQVCQKYGWSYQFGSTIFGEEGNNDDIVVDEKSKNAKNTSWFVDITVPHHGIRRFIVSPDDVKTEVGGSIAAADIEKAGKASVSALALEGLKELIQQEESKPLRELIQVFASEPITIHDSLNSEEAENCWENLIWSKVSNNRQQSDDDSSLLVVGIDVEGNNISPPILIQIATGDNDVILEIPPRKEGRIKKSSSSTGVVDDDDSTTCTLSDNLQRLLQDDRIVKVFCDNFSHKDKRALGLLLEKHVHTVNDTTSDEPQNVEAPSTSSNRSTSAENVSTDSDPYTKAPIVDLEAIAMQLWGPVKVARGLSKIVTLSMPELGVRIGKPRQATSLNKAGSDGQGRGGRGSRRTQNPNYTNNEGRHHGRCRSNRRGGRADTEIGRDSGRYSNTDIGRKGRGRDNRSTRTNKGARADTEMVGRESSRGSGRGRGNRGRPAGRGPGGHRCRSSSNREGRGGERGRYSYNHKDESSVDNDKQANNENDIENDNVQGRYARIGRYAMIEQGKAPPLHSVSDLTLEEQRYAALDAWCTLKAYHRLMQLKRLKKLT